MKYQVASVTLVVGAAVLVVAWLAIAVSLLHLSGAWTQELTSQAKDQTTHAFMVACAVISVQELCIRIQVSQDCVILAQFKRSVGNRSGPVFVFVAHILWHEYERRNTSLGIL